MSEKQIMEATYILSFFQKVGTLNNYYAQYINIDIENKHKYNYSNIEEFKKAQLSDEDKAIIRNAIQHLRIISIEVYMHYQSLKTHMKIDEDLNKAIEEKYDKITTEYLPKQTDLKEYVLKLNKFLTNDIIQDLFDKSSEILQIKNGRN